MKKTLLAATVLLAATAFAEKYDLPPSDINVIGQVQQISAKQGKMRSGFRPRSL